MPGIGGDEQPGGFGGAFAPREFPGSAASTRGVFVSHASEDADLAQAFVELVTDMSSGLIPTYASSSKDQAAGIPYGDDWFTWIRDRIKESGNVVALITPTSVGRPWILFEAGYGCAVEGVRVFGLRLGTSGEEAYAGPFKAFMNSGSEPEELLKLCQQLTDGTPCRPREEMLRDLVRRFSNAAKEHIKKAPGAPKKPNPEAEAVFNALEEIRSLARTKRETPADQRAEQRSIDPEWADSVLSLPNDHEPAVKALAIASLADAAGIPGVKAITEYAVRERVDLKYVLYVLERVTFMGARRSPLSVPPHVLMSELFAALSEQQRRRPRPIARRQQLPREADNGHDQRSEEVPTEVSAQSATK